MASLREQIEAMPSYEGEWVLREAILDLVRWHHCIPDRDVLVRAIADITEEWAEAAEWLADRIIERLKADEYDAIVADLEEP